MSEKTHTAGKNGKFGSRLGFILASVGSAVGMGNIWMFPYRVGQYGGAAFLIVYFGFILLFGLVGLSGEFAFGRLTGTGPIGSYGYALKTRGKKGGALLGAIPLIGSLGIAIGYAIIVGWVLRYLFGSLSGVMMGMEAEVYFSQATGHFGSVPWHFMVVAITMAVLVGGVLKGIEKVNRIMMPAFFILFIIIAVRVFFLDGALAGYEYLLIPRWELLLKPETWVMAMGQAFFSLSITGSGMIIYGSYLDKKEDIPKAAMTTALLDLPFGPNADKIALEDGALVVSSQTGDGTEVRALPLPAAFAADLRLAEPRYVTLPSMMKARKKPVETIEAASLGTDTAPKLTVTAYEAPAARKAGVKVSSVAELVDKLRNEAKVL